MLTISRRAFLDQTVFSNQVKVLEKQHKVISPAEVNKRFVGVEVSLDGKYLFEG